MYNENMTHVIKDPVHGTMQFTRDENNWLKPFIDSTPFQRLRHIKQLGLSDSIFPGAVHTRFNHSLGCAYVAGLISAHIQLPVEERQAVMIACLLHDIGHGPFSHTFENIFTNKSISHEDWTPFFLNEYKQKDFFLSYNQRNPMHPLNDEKFALIEKMIMHQSPVKRLLADIVSSQLDADRLDYLLRDSHFCGVSYGQFDFRWMLNSMVVAQSSTGEARLGLTHKGIGVVEHYLMARRLMRHNIYFNQKTLALESLLIQMLSLLSQHIHDFPDIAGTALGIFLSKTYVFNQTDQSKKIDFIQQNYPLFKELSDNDIVFVIKQLAKKDESLPIVQIAKQLYLRQIPHIIYIEPMDVAQIKQSLSALKAEHAIPDWQLTLIETPLESYATDADPILILNETGIARPLHQQSVMIDAIGDKMEKMTFLCIDRLHYARLKPYIDALTRSASDIGTPS